MVNPKFLCRKHLLGEHNELHKHRHIFIKQRKIDGYIKNNCIEPSSMKIRHDALVEEMIKRGYKHQSPYEQPDISYLPEAYRVFKVDPMASLVDLLGRCEECKKRENK